MPISKHRKNRRTHDALRVPGLLPGLTDLTSVRERGLRLAQTRAHVFRTQDPDRVVAALFDGWTLLGKRVDNETLDGHRHTYMWKHGNLWVGFHLISAPFRIAYKVEADPFVIDYLRLAADSHATNPADWAALNGRERAHRVLDALHPRPHTEEDGPVIAYGPIEFLDALTAKAQAATVGATVGHLYAMADVVLSDDIADPDGQVAAARTLAGLGGYAALTL